ncbi:Proteins P-6/P-7,Chlamydia virulence protein PGP3-D (plasmid) [Chlamydia serpentis]|uniref:Proteins P-6/P-7,Chlamydia virulence protein PGP3-D n=1 Tax=Chlamydia serpentis TaxID=1967782 RepID=A0A2R8FCT3_9CHLA|nr:virulence factor Pgp3 [Chlamydia serpentis]SPN74181.1 Proteins P-6/P-7,Chlamydia virulence protein PGP3-D [Chlamydia serpentis]
MGNSGFYLQDTQNTIFADNIRLGQMTTVLKKDEIIIGTDSTPTVTKFSGDKGIVVATDSTTTPSKTTFSLDMESVIKEVTSKILDQIEDELVKDIIKNITQSLIEEVIKQIQIDPSFSFSRAFKDISISESIQCNGLFTKENIRNLDGGTEIAEFSVTPDNSNSMFLICANIIATRMEGTVALALVKEGDKSPCAISYGYSAGYPNVISLRATVSNATTTPVKFSLRAGGVDSGIVWVNAMPNGEKILGVETVSKITILEVKPQTNG